MTTVQIVTFSLASFVLLAIPGPTIILVISNSLGHGLKYTSPLLGGIAVGDFIAMTASVLGLGTILSESANLFEFCKILGAFYLLYIGVKMWRGASTHLSSTQLMASRINTRTFGTAFSVTALNPKSLIFFIAFVPQFIITSSPVWIQLTVFIGIFVLISVAVSAGYAVLATVLKARLKISNIKYYADRTGGGIMAAAGLMSLIWDGIRR